MRWVIIMETDEAECHYLHVWGPMMKVYDTWCDHKSGKSQYCATYSVLYYMIFTCWLHESKPKRIQLAGQEQKQQMNAETTVRGETITATYIGERARERKRCKLIKGFYANKGPKSGCNAYICLFGDLFISVCLSGVSLNLLLALCQLSPRQPDTRATNSTMSRVSLRRIKAISNHITLQISHPSTMTTRSH